MAHKEVGNYIQAEVPGEDEDSYRVAHIAIRSCKNYEVIEKIKDQLVKNELIFDESKNNLYIKVNDKLINIGSQSSSSVICSFFSELFTMIKPCILALIRSPKALGKNT